MCGIAGFVAPEGTVADRAILERMVGALRHRGPDATGYHVDGRVGLGVARLCIVDLATGDQPLATERGDVHLVLNGEIYNHGPLRDDLTARGHRFATRSDAEVVLHAWEDVGEECVHALNGMFAFALWDRRRAALFLARDRMGEKPLYYASVQGWLVFASEPRALLVHPVVSRRLDLASFARYLAFDYVPDPHSIFAGVAKLPPGHALTASDGKVTIERYWDLTFRPDDARDATAWADEIAARFDRAVALRLGGDVPVGCFVSGGIDSSAVAATAARLRPGIRTFSVGYEGTPYDERRFARIVAELCGTRHEEVVVTPTDAGAVVERLGDLLDEPLADMSFVPLYLLSAAARGTVTVAITGDGGDELFAGYPMMAAEWWHAQFARLPVAVRRALAAGAARLPRAAEPLATFLAALEYGADERNQVLIGGLPPARHAALLSRGAREALAAFEPYGDIAELSAPCVATEGTARLIYRYCKLYLAGQNLVNADRASMAVGLELRAPFLDHTFVDFVGRIPSALKLQGLGRLKRLLKQALADRLPPEIRRRGKQGFGVPFGEWFRGRLVPLVRETLARDRIAAGGVLDAGAVQRLVDEHLSGARDHSNLLWSLLAFEQWRAAYLGASPPAL